MSRRLRVTQLWRYPVKSLRGEQLEATDVTGDGIPGDRLVHVAGTRGLLTGRTRYALLTLDVHTGSDGEPRVAGHRWDSAEAGALIRATAGPDAHLVAHQSSARFDVLPLLVLTEAEVNALAVDPRRLRPNIVISGALPQEERGWPGYALRIGDAVIGVHSVRPRCVVTTIDPDSGDQDLDVLRRIRRERDGAVALNCWTIAEGRVNIGDQVVIEPLPSWATERMPDPGGWVTGAPYRSAASAS